MKTLIIQSPSIIDEDYPKKNTKYAFEIDEPAATRILENVISGFKYEIRDCPKKAAGTSLIRIKL